MTAKEIVAKLTSLGFKKDYGGDPIQYTKPYRKDSKGNKFRDDTQIDVRFYKDGTGCDVSFMKNGSSQEYPIDVESIDELGKAIAKLEKKIMESKNVDKKRLQELAGIVKEENEALKKLVKGIWDGDVSYEELAKQCSPKVIAGAEKLASDLKLKGLPFPDDPEFKPILKHPNYKDLKAFIDKANDDIEM